MAAISHLGMRRADLYANVQNANQLRFIDMSQQKPKWPEKAEVVFGSYSVWNLDGTEWQLYGADYKANSVELWCPSRPNLHWSGTYQEYAKQFTYINGD